MMKKLKRKASRFGHWDESACTSAPLLASRSSGTAKFKTSSVAEIAKIPSANCSSRLGVMGASTRRDRGNPSAAVLQELRYRRARLSYAARPVGEQAADGQGASLASMPITS